MEEYFDRPETDYEVIYQWNPRSVHPTVYFLKNGKPFVGFYTRQYPTKNPLKVEYVMRIMLSDDTNAFYRHHSIVPLEESHLTYSQRAYLLTTCQRLFMVNKLTGDDCMKFTDQIDSLLPWKDEYEDEYS